MEEEERVELLEGAIKTLLNCPDLNLDELDPKTRVAIMHAYNVIEITNPILYSAWKHGGIIPYKAKGAI
jgi:hypothetical protein